MPSEMQNVARMPTKEHRFEVFLRNVKLKRTTERMAILGAIAHQAPHFKADDLWLALQNGPERISRATVYRTLNLLVRAGLVWKANLGSNHACYELAQGKEDHGHLVCLGCAKVFDVYRADFRALQDDLCRERLFLPVQASLQIFGLCQACADREDEVLVRSRLAQIRA